MQFYSKIALLFIAAVLVCHRVQCRTAGPPANEAGNRDRVCNDMLPSHPGNPAPRDGNGGYSISTNLPRISDTEYAYTAGQTYTLTLSHSGSELIRGFLVIGHVPGQPLVVLGAFATGGANQQIIEECDNMGVNMQAAIGHMGVLGGGTGAASTDFLWTAPSNSENGVVDFRFTVVRTRDIFFVAQSAAQTSPDPIVDPTAPPPTTQPPVDPTLPERDPEDYRLTFRSPPNCLLDECNVFVGIDTNNGSSEYLDITMQGVAGGWLAVGFSFTASMFDADVVGCIRDPNTNEITAIDTWNSVADPRTNTRDDTQDIVLFNSSFVNSTISCTFSRLITGSDPTPQDRNLNRDYFILYGYRGADNPPSDIMRFPFHVDATPVSSPVMFNPVNGNNQPFNGVTIPVRDPEDYRLTFRTPEGCSVTNCTSFVGIDTNTGNPGILDIYLEGEAQGWVAVGFTATRNMFDADVVACNRDPGTDMIEALDTYNLPLGTRNNLVDARQNVQLFNGSFDGSRIICTVGKEIAPSDPVPQDVNLNSDNLYVLWGVRVNDSQPGMLLTHGADVPAASLEQVSPAGLGLGLVAPNQAPIDYRLRIRDPPGCAPSECDLYVGIDTNTGNPGFLDIYIEGEAQGWVAVGFSNSRDMFAADVVGCNLDPNTGMVAVVDTWNLNQGRGNTLDATQDVELFNSNFANDRITCTFAKRIAATDENQDLNLDADLFVMYGVGPDGSGAQALRSHVQGAAGNPLLSANRVNAAVDSGDLGENFPMVQLLRAHGILMLIAWPLLAISGIFFAAWMRPALPNGEWFQIHRAFLLSSLFVGAIGFLLAFVAHARSPTPGLITFAENPTGTAHYAIGLIVMLLHIINPLISACRCHPGDKYRWVFNLIHGTTIGLLVEVLALTNIALGLVRFGPSSFFAESNSLTIFWVYIGFLIFFLVVIGVLFLVFTLLSLFSQDEDRSKTAPSLIKPLIGSGPDAMHKPVPSNEGVELAVPGQKPTVTSGDDSEKPKVPSKDAPLRWGALTIFLVVNVIMMLVLIILIAIE